MAATEAKIDGSDVWAPTGDASARTRAARRVDLIMGVMIAARPTATKASAGPPVFLWTAELRLETTGLVSDG